MAHARENYRVQLFFIRIQDSNQKYLKYLMKLGFKINKVVLRNERHIITLLHEKWSEQSIYIFEFYLYFWFLVFVF